MSVRPNQPERAFERVTPNPQLQSAPSNTSDILFQIDVRKWAAQNEARSRDTHISEPREESCFSRDEERNVKFLERSQLLCYSDPPLNVNLEEGINTFVPKSTQGAPVETIIDALKANSFDISNDADVVTYRNNLNKIGGSPYNRRDEWELDAILVDGTVFLDVRHTGGDPNPSHQRFMYYGYRFEALCTRTENQPVNANSEFCSISRLRVADHRILLSCEIDCTLGDPKNEKNALSNYIELKTTRCVQSDKDLTNLYRYKFPKYWLQSFLAGVRSIALGLRTDDGSLVGIKRLRTDELHREAKDHFDSRRLKGYWNPFVCINCIDHVLTSIRNACAGAPGKTVRVRYDPGSGTIIGTSVTNPSGQDVFCERVVECLGKSGESQTQSQQTGASGNMQA